MTSKDTTGVSAAYVKRVSGWIQCICGLDNTPGWVSIDYKRRGW